MKCVEVNELIQRDLDRDLNGMESQNLHRHLQICSECKAFYQRLRQVHLDLESLPKVALPYSIVDNLLPEMDRIDQLNTVKAAQNTKVKKSWLSKNKWLPAITTVAAGFALIFTIAQINMPSNQNNISQDKGQAPMGIASADVGSSKEAAPIVTTIRTTSLDDPNDMVTSSPTNDALNQAKIGQPEIAFTQAGESDVNEEGAPFNDEGTVAMDIMHLSKDPVLTANEPKQPNSLANEDPDGHLSVKNPTFTVSDTEPMLNSLPAPDHAHVAWYNETYIEIKSVNNESILHLVAADIEHFSNINWLNATQLQFTIKTNAISQIWIYDISTGSKVLISETRTTKQP